MQTELFIAGRYLRSKRRTGFISLITYISAAGVMIGVAALVIVLSVANGFETEVRDRILGADAHVRLTLYHESPMKDYKNIRDQVVKLDHVKGASPFINGKGMLRRGKAIEPALIKGIDEDLIGEVSDLPQTIVAGKLRLNNTDDSLDKHDQKNGFDFDNSRSTLPGIILGKQISFRLGATVGDSLIAFSPSGMTSLFSAPQIKRFIVTGIFETGIFEYDDSYCYVSINSAQDLFSLENSVTGVEMKLDDIDKAPKIKQKLSDMLGYPYYARTWYDLHSVLFRWMKLEKWLYTILLSLIILVAAFNIISSQIMIVLEKKREIGILRAIGMPKQGIMKIFMYEGLIVGIIGTILGIILGWLICWGQQTYEWFSLPGDVYFLSVLPVKMQVQDFVIITIVSMFLTVIATVYPARRAGKLDPVEAIRYE